MHQQLQHIPVCCNMSSKLVLIGAMMTHVFAAALLFAETQASQVAIDIGVLADARRMGICVVGAAIGAFLTIAMFPPDGDLERKVIRRLAMKFGASMFGGIAVTPGLIEWCDWPSSADSLLTISCLVAAFVVSALHIVAPRLERVIDKYWPWTETQ